MTAMAVEALQALQREGFSTIGTALISVFDKADVVELAGFLRERGVQILSTGGTLKTIKIGRAHV